GGCSYGRRKHPGTRTWIAAAALGPTAQPTRTAARPRAVRAWACYPPAASARKFRQRIAPGNCAREIAPENAAANGICGPRPSVNDPALPQAPQEWGLGQTPRRRRLPVTGPHGVDPPREVEHVLLPCKGLLVLRPAVRALAPPVAHGRGSAEGRPRPGGSPSRPCQRRLAVVWRVVA